MDRAAADLRRTRQDRDDRLKPVIVTPGRVHTVRIAHHARERAGRSDGMGGLQAGEVEWHVRDAAQP